MNWQARLVLALGVCLVWADPAMGKVCQKAAQQCPNDACKLALLTAAAAECADDASCAECVKGFGWTDARRFGDLKVGGLVAWDGADVAMVFTAPNTLSRDDKWMPAAVNVRGYMVPLKKILEGGDQGHAVQYMWVHRGFWGIARRAYRAAAKIAAPMRRSRLLVAGYGAGGAVAEIVAWMLIVEKNWKVAAQHTFGAPPVGGRDWSRSASMMGLSTKIRRWRMGRDRRPPKSGHPRFQQWLRERAAAGPDVFAPIGDCRWLGKARDRGIEGYIERLRGLSENPASSCPN